MENHGKSWFTPSIHWLLVFIPIAFAVRYIPAFHTEVGLFIVSCLAIIPLAKIMGNATEIIAERCGPTVGGFLNATFGNAAELIIGLMALSKGFADVVKASLTGSIIGNLLLVLGLSMIFGGSKFKTQTFSKTHASAGATALIIASIALFIPTVYHFTAEKAGGWSPQIEQNISWAISLIILLSYFLQLLFSLKTHKPTAAMGETSVEPGQPEPSDRDLKKAGATLLGATFFVGIFSEYMVGSIEAVQIAFGLSEIFIGVIVVAIVGNAAEHSTAILMAMKNKMDLSLEIAIGSSLQVALFIAPVLVLASYAFGKPMTLEFTVPEVVAVMSSVWIIAHVVTDGDCNWLEGAQLVTLYLILGVLFYYLPVK